MHARMTDILTHTCRTQARAFACARSQDALRLWDQKLRYIYMWYCTLDDPRVFVWERVIESRVEMTPDAIVLMLSNFNVGCFEHMLCAALPLTHYVTRMCGMQAQRSHAPTMHHPLPPP